MNINEEQKPAKLIKLRKTTYLIMKEHFYKSFAL